MPPQQGASPQLGGAPSGAPPQGAGMQIIAGIVKLAQMLGQVFPAASPMAEEIQKQVRLAQSKMSEAQTPSQPQAPPI
jgi:hypothetical protein